MRPSSNTSVNRLVLASFRVVVLLLSWLLCTNLGRAQQPVANASPIRYSQGNPTDQEQYLLERLNRARLDPVGEGQRLADWLRNTTVGLEVTAQYNVNVDQVVSDFAALPAVQPLAFNGFLITASEEHSADLAAHGGEGPNNDPDNYWDGVSIDDHVYDVGYRTVDDNDGWAGGCAFGDVPDLDTIHAGYLIDWGNPDFGHRKQEMSSEVYMDVVGMGLATQADHNLSDTENYGRTALVSAFLTGVVYHDANGNGLYDVGEGVAGVTVTVDGSSFSTVTSASGGYALPLTKGDGTKSIDNLTGTLTVHMTGFADGSTRDGSIVVNNVDAPVWENGVQVSIGNQWPLSVKWDAPVSQKAATPAPTDPTHASLAGGGSVAKGGKLLLVVSRPAAQGDLSQPLTLAYTLKGSAVASIDYQPLSGSVTIPAGKRRAKLTIQALDLNVINRPAGTWTLQLKLRGVKGAQGKASVTFTSQ